MLSGGRDIVCQPMTSYFMTYDVLCCHRMFAAPYRTRYRRPLHTMPYAHIVCSLQDIVCDAMPFGTVVLFKLEQATTDSRSRRDVLQVTSESHALHQRPAPIRAILPESVAAGPLPVISIPLFKSTFGWPSVSESSESSESSSGAAKGPVRTRPIPP